MNKILLLLLALGSSAALAHTAVTAVVPGPALSVPPPRTVTLRFSEPVELRFSSFRVMAVPAGRTPQAAAALALAEPATSARLVSLPVRGLDRAAQLALPLRAPLSPGLYVVAWKLLSEDGHPVSGQSTFRVR